MVNGNLLSVALREEWKTLVLRMTDLILNLDQVIVVLVIVSSLLFATCLVDVVSRGLFAARGLPLL